MSEFDTQGVIGILATIIFGVLGLAGVSYFVYNKVVNKNSINTTKKVGGDDNSINIGDNTNINDSFNK